MAQSLQVNLSFTADSAKAKAQIQDLQNSLNNLMRNNPTGKADLPVTKELLKAQQAAAQLSISLKNATDVNTGKLNLTQFSSELQKSGMTLEKYRTQLSALGPEGEKTFLNLAKSVMTADSAIKTSNKLVNDLWISLKNTAKWQLSSSMVKGFMGAISTAFNYAEDLNKSLNQIQIVTGNSAEQMARFAKQANIAAKELSTTTTAYTDASLIYYQQGLDDASVKARTDITIKAANAAGTNAAEMSDYLTAVWNSYKVGSNELERYVDVMAALGAGTATSLEEISTAMEKVASVGEATGVKFEQMSSIIATVSSVTRQSAETVGTAFKTIFARMADLKLEGSIEEDGITTTLGTVSKQLAQVGVNILDANGELRDMGDVTEELMGKWNTMNEATQQAVAIAIAGKRQYTQLLALMNNQDMYRDAMAMATGAEGTLQEQADTYAKSWGAAQKRVKAAAQGIYDSLINDDFFIGMNDAIADVLGMIEKLIDSMGGFSGVLGGLGALALKVFDKQIAAGLQKTIQSIYSTSEIGKKQAEILRQQAFQSTQQVFADRANRTETGSIGIYDQASLETQKQRLELEKQFIDNAKTMTEDEVILAQKALDTNKAYEERALLQAKQREKYTNLYNENYADAKSQAVLTSDFGKEQESINRLNELLEVAKQNTSEISMSMKEAFSGIDVNTATFSQIENGLIDIEIVSDEVEAHVDELWESLIRIEKEGINTTKGQNDFKKLKQTIQDLTQGSNTMEKEFIKSANAIGINTNTARDLIKNYSKMNESTDKAKKSMKDFKQASQGLNQGLQMNKTVSMVFVENLMSSFRAVSSLTIGLSSLKGAFQALNDPDMSTFDKVISVLMSLSIGIPSVVSGVKLLRESFIGATSEIQKAITAELGLLATQAQRSAQTAVDTTNIATNTAARQLNNIQRQQSYGYTALETIALQANTDATKLSTIESLKLLAAQKLGLIVLKEDGTFQAIDATTKGANTVATWLLKIAQDALNGSIGATLVLLGIFVIAIGAAVAIVYGLVKAFQALQVASPEEKLKKANEEVERTKTVFKEASESVDKLKSSLDSLEDSHKNLNNLTKGTKEYNEALDIANQKALELMSTNATLAEGMYLDDNIIKFSEDSVQQAIKESEGHKIVAYGENINAQIERKKAELDVQASRIANKEFNAEGKEKNWNSTYARDESYKHYSEKDLINYANEYLKQGEDFFNHPYTKMTNTGTSIDNIITSNDKLQQYIRELAEILKQQNNLTNTQNELLAQSISQNLGITEEDYISPELYAQAKEKSIDQATKLIDGWNDHFNYKENDQIITDFIKAQYGDNPESNVSYVAQRHGQMVISVDGEEKKFTEEQVKSSLAAYYASDEYAKLVNDKIIEDIKTIFEKSSISEEDISNLSKEEAIALGNNKDLLTYVSENTSKDLNIQDLQALSDLLQNNSTSSEIKEVGEQLGLTGIKLEEFVDIARSASDSLNFLNRDISGLINSLSNQEELTDEQKQLLDDLKDAYPELKDAANEYADSFINNLNIIQNDLEALDIHSKSKEMKDLVKELNLLDEEGNIKINIDDRNFNDTLDQILDKSYEIEVAIRTDIDSDIANMQSALDKMQNATNLISESWRVSQQDLQELASIYPGILRQSEILADGTVQLNSKIAQGAIEAANADLQANKNTALGKLEMEKAFLTAKLGYLQNMADAVDILNDNEVASDEEKNNAKASLEKNLSDLIALCQGDNAEVSSSVAASRVVDENQVGKAGSENAQESDTNWIAAYQSITKASAESARARIQNENAVATAIASGGKTSGEVSEGNISSTYSGSHTDSTYSNDTQVKTEGSNAGKIADLQGLIANADYSSLGKRISQDQSSVIKQLGIVEDAMTIVQSISKTAEYNSQYASTGGSGGSGSSGGSGGGGKGGSGGGKGGSGGGKSDSGKDKSGSSSRRPETADLKNLDEEITRYKNVDNQLASIENHLDKISHKKDQAYGKKYIDALYEENEALQKQIDLHRQSQSDAIKYQAWDKQKVAELGFNIETDEAGYVTNEEQFDAWITQNENAIELGYTNSVNALGEDSDDQRNALEEQKKAQLDNIEAAKTYFNLYKEATERRYKDESDIEELLAQQRENNYDAINKKLEIQMDLLDRERNHMEFLRNTFREGFFGIADNLENDRAQFGNLTQQMNDLQTTMAEVQEKFNTSQISESQYIELMQDLSDRAEEAGTSLYELSEQIVGRFSEALEGANEILDNTIDKFEHLRGLSDSVINLMKLTYGEEAYKKLDPMLKNQEEIAKNQLSATRKIYYEAGEWLESKRLAYEAVKGQGDQEEDAAKRMYDEALDNYNERQSQYYEALTAAAEAAMAVYENSVNKSLQDYENKLTDGLGFDALQQQLNHLQEMDELYLTNENQQYRTQKLIRTALNDMDKTENKVAKNKIELFIKQTRELQKQGKLSEYQMSIKEKEYNILLAQLALEDAQNNKSQVRLQRDSEGNFNYVYTADENNLLEKQQEVDDAINDLYNYEREMVNEMNQRALDSAKEAGEQLREIAEQYGTDSKEYIEAQQRLLAEHGEVITAIKEHMTITQNSIDQSYLDSYNLIIDDEIAITDNWKNTFVKTSNEIKTASQTLQKDTNLYMREMNNDYIKVKDTSNDLRQEVSTNLNQISPIMNKVALDTSYWAVNMNEYLGSVAAAYENIANACATAAHTISGYMPDIDYHREFVNETDMNKMSSLLSTRQYITKNNIDGRAIWGMNTEGGLDLFNGINYAEVIQNTAIQGLGDTIAINAVANAAAHRIIKMQESGDYYNSVTGTEKLLKKIFGDGDIFNAIVDAMKENNNFIGFDTGGYTGDFGPEGKFAILHEKELVLNQQDTQNLLDTVDIVDKLLNSLEYQNLLYDFNISNIGNGINKNKDTLEQDVTIHAEFPNVQDHNEIEMALSNLVNTASQYANRKKS